MNRTKKWRTWLIGLLCASLLLSLAACESTTQNDEKQKTYHLASIQENLADYLIVYSASAEPEIAEAAQELCDTLADVSGIRLTLYTDAELPEPGSHPEIRVGVTNRATTAAPDAGQFVIEEDEAGNIQILGSDHEQTAQAAAAFLTQYFGAEVPDESMVHNVRTFGAVGDGVADDTDAFKKAVAAAETDGLPVYVPGGIYCISDTIQLNSVTLYGQSQGAWTADVCGLPQINQSNMYQPLFDVCSGSLAGVSLQAFGEANNKKMQPTVRITGVGGRVTNLRINTPYIGIYTDDTSNPGRCFIDNIFIIEAKKIGVYVAGTYDVPTITNVEVWNPVETCPVAFWFGHNDDLRAVNLFAFRANVGFLIEETETGAFWGSFTNCSADLTATGIRVGKGAHHLTVTGGTYWTHLTAVEVTGECTGHLVISGCELTSYGDYTLKVSGGNTVTVSGCSILHDYETDIPAVSVRGGRLVNISGNTIYSRPTAIELFHQSSGAVSMVNNTIYTGGSEVKDFSQNCEVRLDNVVFENADFSDLE